MGIGPTSGSPSRLAIRAMLELARQTTGLGVAVKVKQGNLQASLPGHDGRATGLFLVSPGRRPAGFTRSLDHSEPVGPGSPT